MKRPLLLSAAALLLVAACGEKTNASNAEAAKTPISTTGEDRGVPPLDADGIPRFRAGLWEVVRTDPSGEEGPETIRECIGAEADEQIREMINGTSKSCAKSVSKGIHGLRVALTCDMNGTKVQSAVAIAGTDTKYTLRLDMQMTAKDGKVTTMNMTGKARRLGDCPAGMSPGDSVDAEGGEEDAA